MSSLGYYQKSYQLMMYPLSNITSVINPVLQPFLSDYQDQKDVIAAKNTKMIQLLASISFPIGMFCFLSSEEIVMLMFGEQWIAAVPAFRILSLSIPLQVLFSTSGSIYQSANATNYMFYVEIVNSGITILGFFLSLLLGKTIEWFAVAWDITLFLGFMFSYTVLYRIVLRVSPIQLFKKLIPMLLYCLLIVLFYYVHNLFDMNWNLFVSMSVKGLVCVIAAFIKMLLSKDLLLSLVLKKI